MGSLGFEPRIANAPGWYTKPSSTELTQDTQISPSIRRPQQQEAIINTLINLTNKGKAKNTVRGIASALRQINNNTDITNVKQVETYIANLPRNPHTKNRYALAYSWYCKTNGIQWQKPYFKWERKVPMIPTTENVDKIISACTTKYATIFTILKETGFEAHELSSTHRNDIDAQRGIINVIGCKGHNSRSFKLKPATAELLRKYLAEYPEPHPFPNSHALGEAWRNTRAKVAKNLNQPELKKIPMRNLRHYFATHKYDQTKDILLVKQLLGHKKLETTMFYVQLIVHDNEEEYTVKTATNIKEATDLLEHGFQYVQEIDGISLYRKRR